MLTFSYVYNKIWIEYQTNRKQRLNSTGFISSRKQSQSKKHYDSANYVFITGLIMDQITIFNAGMGLIQIEDNGLLIIIKNFLNYYFLFKGEEFL